MSERGTSRRISVRLSGALSEFVARIVGVSGLYETPSEYIRDLVRRDMEWREGPLTQDSMLAGYRDLASGKAFPSAVDFKKDMKALEQKEKENWR